MARELGTALAAVNACAADRREIIARVGVATPALLAVGAASAPHRPWDRWWLQWSRSGRELVSVRPLLAAEEVAHRLDIEPGPVLGRALDLLVRAQVRGEVRTPNGARRWLRRLGP